jgi:hypothetical protein
MTLSNVIYNTMKQSHYKDQLEVLKKENKALQFKYKSLKTENTDMLGDYIMVQMALKKKLDEESSKEHREKHDQMLYDLDNLMKFDHITYAEYDQILRAHSNLKTAMLAVKHLKLKMYVSNDPYENTNWRCMLLGTPAGKYRMVPPVNW